MRGCLDSGGNGGVGCVGMYFTLRLEQPGLSALSLLSMAAVAGEDAGEHGSESPEAAGPAP